MNFGVLHNKLIAAARSVAPNQRVPYAFEKRIMARLTQAPRLDAWTIWSHALWKAAASCVAITLLCGAWAMHNRTQVAKADLGREFEMAVFASASTDEAW